MNNFAENLPTNETDWDAIAPIGREFGSADYERLAEMDHQACLVTGSTIAARRWLDLPQDALDGGIPEELAKSPQGYVRVMEVLKTLRTLDKN